MKEEIRELTVDVLSELSGVDAGTILNSKDLVNDLGLNRSKMKQILTGVEIGIEEEVENVREIPFEKFDNLCESMLNAKQLDEITELIFAVYETRNGECEEVVGFSTKEYPEKPCWEMASEVGDFRSAFNICEDCIVFVMKNGSTVLSEKEILSIGEPKVSCKFYNV